MKFEEIYNEYKLGRLNASEASDILGISERTFLRKRDLFDSDSFDGRFDLRLGRSCRHKGADEEISLVTRLYSEKFKEFSVKHFHEYAQRDYGLKRSYSWVKSTLFEHGLIKKSTRGGKHRRRRERRAMRGMMLHQDGSRHLWIESLGYMIDLIVTLDDATSEIVSAFFVEEEGTKSSFRGVREAIEGKGLFCSLYTDRGSHYFYTAEAGEKVLAHHKTQFGRALSELHIKHIAAYSPQARGRSERMFGTLQGRLPQELKLSGIKTIEDANHYLSNVYLPRHNAQFSIAPKDGRSAYMKWNGSLKDILCIQEERIVQNDNTIRYRGKILQIPKSMYRHHYAKAHVRVHEYEDGSCSVFHGPLRLGDYDTCGNLLKQSSDKMEFAA